MSEYYTPTIEEFHVGFEYEINVDGCWEDTVEDFEGWYKYKFKVGNCFRELYDIEENINNIRVKYLDSSDIESFGFKQGILPYQFFDGVHKLIILENNRISIEHIADECYLFYGKIKNKSELEAVLKMLEIIK